MTFEIVLTDIKLISDNERIQPSKRGVFVASKAYRDCKKMLTEYFNLMAIKQGIRNPLKEVSIYYKITTYKDMSNLFKIINDSLEKAGVIENDRYILKMVAEKVPIKRGQPDSLVLGVYEF